MFNVIHLYGDISSDFGFRTQDNGHRYIAFTVDVVRKAGMPDKDVIQVVAFDDKCDEIRNNCHKGDMVAIQGTLRQRTRPDGSNTYVVYVMQLDILLLDESEPIDYTILPEEPYQPEQPEQYEMSEVQR